jgi:hypothetical protein
LGIGTAANPGLKAFLQNGTVGSDANKTAITTYISQFGGYAMPVAGTTYASVLAAKPSGGVTAGLPGTTTSPAQTTVPPSLTGTSLLGSSGSSSSSSSSTSVYADPMTGYAGGSGSSMGDTRNLLSLIAGAACLTWLAYVLLGSWTAFATGRAELRHMSGDIVRGMAVVMLIVFIIW